MKPDWSPLRRCLAACRASGLDLPIWWRDDDATATGPALDRLEALAVDIGIDVHLAIVPGHLEADLAAHLGTAPRLVPVVHGWRHENRAPPLAKRAEFGTFRTSGVAELHDALHTMQDAVGGRLVRLFVPPWNRIDPAFLPELAAAGYLGVSTFTPRRGRLAVPGLVEINTHVDPFDWHGSRDLDSPERIVAHTVALLEDRRVGLCDREEPLGYLTHHLVHTERLWEFSRQFLMELLAGGARAQPIAPLLETRHEPT